MLKEAVPDKKLLFGNILFYYKIICCKQKKVTNFV